MFCSNQVSTQQLTSIDAWFNYEKPFPGCPPGLECLSQFNKIILENSSYTKYILKNDESQQFLHVERKAENGFCRSKHINFFHGFDRNNKEIIQFILEKHITSFFYSSYEMNVEAPPGTLIGTIKSKKENYEIFDDKGNVILEIEKKSSFCSNDEFKLLTTNEKNENGQAIYKYDKGYFISFPIDLSVKTKATLIGAYLILIHNWNEASAAAAAAVVIA